jgi:hypothetical protein
VLLNTQEGIQGGITIVWLNVLARDVKRENGNVVVLSFNVSRPSQLNFLGDTKLTLQNASAPLGRPYATVPVKIWSARTPPPPALFISQADIPGRSLIIRVVSGRGESLDASTSFADPKGRRYHFRPLGFRISIFIRYCGPKFIFDRWRAGQYRRTRVVYASRR